MLGYHCNPSYCIPSRWTGGRASRTTLTPYHPYHCQDLWFTPLRMTVLFSGPQNGATLGNDRRQTIMSPPNHPKGSALTWNSTYAGPKVQYDPQNRWDEYLSGKKVMDRQAGIDSTSDNNDT